MRQAIAGGIEALLTVDEVAARLRVKPATIRKWVHMRMIPVVRLGRAVRFSPHELTSWIDERSQKQNAWD
jgi:excisionase family DNA binding protein